MTIEILEVKITAQAGNDWIVRLSEREGWWMVPTRMVSAAENMRNVRKFWGNPQCLKDVTLSGIMGLRFCGFPLNQEYYTARMAELKEPQSI